MTNAVYRYIIATNENDKPIAYLHYRFDIDFDSAVLYWLVNVSIYFRADEVRHIPLPNNTVIFILQRAILFIILLKSAILNCNGTSCRSTYKLVIYLAVVLIVRNLNVKVYFLLRRNSLLFPESCISVMRYRWRASIKLKVSGQHFCPLLNVLRRSKSHHFILSTLFFLRGRKQSVAVD